MKILLPHWRKRISPVFDVSDNVLLLEIERGEEVSRENLRLREWETFARAREITALEIEEVICGAISRELEKALNGAGIRVRGFICGDVEDVIAAFLNQDLTAPRFRMPGSCETDESPLGPSGEPTETSRPGLYEHLPPHRPVINGPRRGGDSNAN